MVDKHDRHHGFPTVVERSKKIIFHQVKEMIWNKLKDCKEKTLSRMGKRSSSKQLLKAYLLTPCLSFVCQLNIARRSNICFAISGGEMMTIPKECTG